MKSDVKIDEVRCVKLTLKYVVISWVVFAILAPIINYVFGIGNFWMVFWSGLTCTSIIAPIVCWLSVRNTLRAEALGEQLTASTESLKKARDEATRAARVKAEFLAVMSHEIRTPLNGVLGLAQVLASRPLPADDHRLASKLQSSGEMLLSILNDILDISKIEAGEMQIDPVRTDLFSLSDDVRDLFSPVAEGKGLYLTLELDSALSQFVLTDPVRLRQCISNLLSNAIKFTTDGGVAVRISAEEMDGGTHKVHVDVQDTGIGMSREVQREIFKPFRQADGSTAREFGGTGLGLSITRQLAGAMDGDVRIVKSKPYAGTHVRLTISAPSLEPEHPTGRAKGIANRASVCDGLSILVVDDTATNRLILRLMLENARVQVTEVESGEDALKILRTKRFDAVLLDVHMPGMTGPETFVELKRQFGSKAPPVIAVTAEALSGDWEKFLKMGMAGYVSKPVLSSALFDEIQACLTKPKPASAAAMAD